MIYESVYPPAYNSTYIKTNAEFGAHEAYTSWDPALSLTGGWNGHGWLCDSYDKLMTVDLGTPQIVTRFYYEGAHDSGYHTGGGYVGHAKEFTFWGSNSATAFADTDYTHDTDWTELTTAASILEEHIGADVADPKYMLVMNATPFQYYRIKVHNAWADAFSAYIGLRRIELQIELPTPYTSRYPIQDTSHVKATTIAAPNANWYPHLATEYPHVWGDDPTHHAWINDGTAIHQRFHIDLGSEYIIRRIYYEGLFNITTDYADYYKKIGIKDFTFYGSNSSDSFNDLVYGDNAGWELIGFGTFDKQVDGTLQPQYRTFNNYKSYRYYAITADTSYDDIYNVLSGIGHIELQTQDGYTIPPVFGKAIGKPQSDIGKINNVSMANIKSVADATVSS
jgi:hypothetical protein